MLHRLETLAFDGWQTLQSQYPSWAAAHETHLTNDYTRWIEEPTFTWFGLSDDDLGTFHSNATQAYHEYSGKASNPGRDVHLIHGLRHAHLAISLCPHNEATTAKLEELFDDEIDRLEAETGPGFFGACTLPYIDIDGEDRTFDGDENMVRSWGPSGLLYLERARKLAVIAHVDEKDPAAQAILQEYTCSVRERLMYCYPERFAALQAMYRQVHDMYGGDPFEGVDWDVERVQGVFGGSVVVI